MLADIDETRLVSYRNRSVMVAPLTHTAMQDDPKADLPAYVPVGSPLPDPGSPPRLLASYVVANGGRRLYARRDACQPGSQPGDSRPVIEAHRVSTRGTPTFF